VLSNLPKAYIFGAGVVGQSFLSISKNKYNIIAFLDNDVAKHGCRFMGINVLPTESIVGAEYDRIIVASHAGISTITEQLLGLGVERLKIDTDYVDFTVKSRIVLLNKLGELFAERGIKGSVAECGVFMGEFAKEINRTFPDSKLYLFDTFEGFDERDLLAERELGADKQSVQYSDFKAGHFGVACEDVVMKNMPYPDKCIVQKGYFPETTNGVCDTFCFVNLDFDLYQPTLAGLRYFYPRMVKGGVILVHDYFSGACAGVRIAVKQFEETSTHPIRIFPIGDGLSVGINC